MWLCEGSKIDWTAVAAIIALMIWLIDGHRRTRERRAAGRLLAQIMTTPVGAAHLDIVKLRASIVPANGDTSYVLSLLYSHEGRKDLACRTSLIKFELPSQFLDKADLFKEVVTNRLALALSEVSRLRSMSQMLGDLSDTAAQEEIDQILEVLLTQLQSTENAIGEAFQVLVKAARCSPWMRQRKK